MPANYGRFGRFVASGFPFSRKHCLHLMAGEAIIYPQITVHRCLRQSDGS